jgi:ribosome-interacting GTPase 1
MQTYLIDLLNGFPYHFFDADFVLTVDPITDSGNQQVIIKLIDFVNTSKNYILINKMQDADVTVNIYRRINKIPNDQINSLLNEFKILYPNSIFDKNNFLE